MQDYARFLAASPKDMPALQGRAKANFSLKRYEAALNDLDAAFQIDQKNFTVRSSIGAVLDAMGRKATQIPCILFWQATSRRKQKRIHISRHE